MSLGFSTTQIREGFLPISEHIPQIALLEKECFSAPWSENALSQEIKNENSYFLVAYSDKVLGYIGVQEICGEAYITNIAVEYTIAYFAIISCPL